ncbi:ligand-binding sensor domain-containing protein [Moheibacter sediminis]|uniref:Two component regulator propeller n=1 Tax=Moheibacter sediminis TaxID=1434700 RepID=A0A1W1Z1S6_9FLAO|nr:two-component regulator propeller domain-containing protein [Moheibacter sediminis]SMC42343.1 Two component regulator propeller [Moheibacter sediminis]
MIYKNTGWITTGVWLLLLLLNSCNGQSNPQNIIAVKEKPVDNKVHTIDFSTKVVNKLSENILCMLQDKNGHYWFGTNGDGIYKYDGVSLIQLTEQDGLGSNHVSAIQEDAAGNLWFSTSQGLCKFNTGFFSNYAHTLKAISKENLHYKSDHLFFENEGIVYQYDGVIFTKFPIHPSHYQTSASNLDRPYGIYCMLKDKAGNLWFGTDQKGVCRYDGEAFTYFTEKGLSGAAVRTIFQDSKGNLWFGNNGYGLFRYDGKKLTNFTEEKGLSNPEFLKKTNTSKNSENLARVWAINEDRNGTLWIGTIDAGVWSYNTSDTLTTGGRNLRNFTTKDGIENNKMNTIYKDSKGDLWFITEGEGVRKFNGEKFEKVTIGQK